MGILAKQRSNNRNPLADALKTGVSEILTANNPTFGEGGGKFTIRYGGTYEPFIEKLQTSMETLAVTLSAKASSPTLLMLEMQTLPSGAG